VVPPFSDPPLGIGPFFFSNEEENILINWGTRLARERYLFSPFILGLGSYFHQKENQDHISNVVN